ncbi:NAD(P)/FAD-dependent oxidoreductase [Francisella philomiragia]|uniref:NAD(P)/FAD-dependent oxidoreductase n=1 Tax=Francisella philomiragia TaxID=28110 RepID=UPI001908A911|nr:FAD-dependent oxidoreductase [Francisella philomiragia]MBK2093270.1 NAD(P)-binding protein [Francisella philomiragia]MBK2256585.1 NAD(P)-binding protein [Francisella philomiragia]MBK2269243.1 NAD(P)-binding protein [Francisella philomiragia]MBK2271392.1 NAD(P)-binding protein [Francisella philomiragia]MBK2275172.1 NAD(P)-binding protein [Francisella philomiragia]
MEKVAVIGSGISGLAISYLLKEKYDITLYEKNNYYGGHARTLEVNSTPVDTGFIVFNYDTYYHLSRLFKHLDVPVAESNMSFGVSIKNGKFEYGSSSIKSLFAQWSNIFRPSYYKMIKDILKFNKISRQHLENNTLDENISLAEYLESINVGNCFKDYYLLAMGACIWSTPLEKMYDFPALSFIRFFDNHGLLTTTKPVQWYTVKGGSKVYVDKIITQLKSANVKFAPQATNVTRTHKTLITDINNNTIEYDKVIFACHSNEVLELLGDADSDEKKLISAIKYQPNSVILHTDASIMPKRKAAWSSWNYLSAETKDKRDVVSLSYWMNNLQPLDTNIDYFVTVNPDQKPDPQKIINEHTFDHPVFDKKAIQAQKDFDKIQGLNNTYYCGAYLRYGFHEDGILSAVNVANKLGIKTPW